MPQIQRPSLLAMRVAWASTSTLAMAHAANPAMFVATVAVAAERLSPIGFTSFGEPMEALETHRNTVCKEASHAV
jgi:hypothetical protein